MLNFRITAWAMAYAGFCFGFGATGGAAAAIIVGTWLKVVFNYVFGG